MNAPARIGPARDRYVSIVTHHMPGLEPGGEEMRARCSILLLRDQATSRLRDCGEEAVDALRAIERLATLHAFRIMPDEDLKRLHFALVRLTAVASDLNVLAFNLTQGANARG